MVWQRPTISLEYYLEYYSRRAVRELRMIAEALEEKIVCAAIWSSLPISRAWSAERNPKPSAAVIGRAKQVTAYLKKYGNVLFLHFMSECFDHLTTLSKIFHKDDLTVGQAVESQEACFWDITSLKIEMGPQMAKINQANPTQSTLEAERTRVIVRKNNKCTFNHHPLQQGGTVAKFRPLDPSSWPVCNRTDPVARER
ncbi:hypothetical protein N1851_006974 [Merluccius polli]|uniref:Uncharacterized protein n=1 Tax=Merluccius polli TaxID=89951 RepID=A0AA47N3I2_MERPO|nr:hypothetical protein N1851_006974 [Merluccius polli]